jgi:hypothetical protein
MALYQTNQRFHKGFEMKCKYCNKELQEGIIEEGLCFCGAEHMEEYFSKGRLFYVADSIRNELTHEMHKNYFRSEYTICLKLNSDVEACDVHNFSVINGVYNEYERGYERVELLAIYNNVKKVSIDYTLETTTKIKTKEVNQ